MPQATISSLSSLTTSSHIISQNAVEKRPVVFTSYQFILTKAWPPLPHTESCLFGFVFSNCPANMYYISLSSFNNDSKASFLYNDIHHKHWLLVIFKLRACPKKYITTNVFTGSKYNTCQAPNENKSWIWGNQICQWLATIRNYVLCCNST